jgi:hypothetical protein
LKANPERGDGCNDRDDDGKREESGVVPWSRFDLQGEHPGVVHQRDSATHPEAGLDQPLAVQGAPADGIQRDTRRGDGERQGKEGDRYIVGNRDGQAEGEHADKVHGPNSAAHGHSAAR